MSELLFSRRALTSAVNSPDLKLRPLFFYDTFFKNRQSVYADTVDFEIIKGSNGLASFNRIGSEANRVAAKDGSSLVTYKLPSIREKDVVTAPELRTTFNAGNIYVNGGQDVATRRRQLLAQMLTKFRNRVQRRIEWMCAGLLQGGFTYVDANGVVQLKVDLAFPTAYKPVYAGNDLWNTVASGKNTADIQSQIMDISDLISDATGAPAATCVLGSAAAKAFMKHTQVKGDLDTLNYRVGQLAPTVRSNYLGAYQGVEFWRYTHKYTDVDGVVKDMMPTNGAIFLPDISAFEHEVTFGMIDEVDGEFVGEFFSKTWTTEDPSERWLLVASRPMPMIKQVGSVVYATVTA